MSGNGVELDSVAMSQMTLRAVIGIIAMLFPFVLLIGGWIFHHSSGDSISAYYHLAKTVSGYPFAMGDIFVGVLFLVGLSLIFYQGHRIKSHERFSDNLITNIAGFCALGVALFPNNDDLSVFEDVVGVIHFAFAGVFFVALGIISWFVFTRSDPAREMSPRKKKRNRTYRRCAIVIGIAVLLVAMVSIIGVWWPDLQNTLKKTYSIIFWIETMAVVAFGYSWWVKANTTLADLFDRAKNAGAPAGDTPD